MSTTTKTAETGLMLVGMNEINRYVGGRPRQGYHWLNKFDLPVFRIGKTVCAYKSDLEHWVEERAKSQTPAPRKYRKSPSAYGASPTA